MKFQLTINCDNAAFFVDDDLQGEEIARILREAADKLEHGHAAGPLYDVNGNRVGSFNYSAETPSA